MRTVVAALLGLIGGVIAGFAISEIIGIVGYLVFDSAVGSPGLALWGCGRNRECLEQIFCLSSNRRWPGSASPLRVLAYSEEALTGAAWSRCYVLWM